MSRLMDMVLMEEKAMQYLFRDLFTTAKDAGAVNGTVAEPGGTATTVQKTRNVVDTESKLSTNSALIFAGGKASASYTDPRLNYGSFVRALGRAILAKLTLPATDKYIRFGWSTSTTDINSEAIALFNNTANVGFFPSATLGMAYDAYSSGVEYQIAIVLANPGAFFLIKGGAFTNWTLLAAERVGNTGTLTPGIFNHSSAANIKEFDVLDLPRAWTLANGVASGFSATPSAGDVIVSDPNNIVQFYWTATTNGILDLDIRRIDADNRWIVRCDQAGSTIKLIERIFGVETERDSKAQTFTNGVQYRIMTRCENEIIKTFVDATAKATFTFASNNKFSTIVKTSAAGANLAAYPRYFSGGIYPTAGLATSIPTYRVNKRYGPVLAKRAGKWDAYSTREIAILIGEDGNIALDGDGKMTSFYWGKPDLATQPAIGIAKSLDGLAWDSRLDTPVLSGAGVGWYSLKVLAASVIKRTADSVLMMMCQGNTTLGAFTSADGGATWAEVGQKITLADYTIGGSAITIAGVPACIKLSSGDYVMLFEGRVSGNDWRIFGATSTDFVGTWTPMNGGLALFSETGTDWESVGVANPRLIEDTPGHFVMAYNGISATTPWQIGLAMSTDLLSWARQPENPIIHRGADAWESYETETSFLVKENYPSKIYYQGYATGNEPQIGLAEFY